jgi:hypothetical protein
MPCKSNAATPARRPGRSAISNSERVTVKQGAKKGPRGASHAGKKVRRHTAAFSTLKSRQQAVDRAKLQVWRHLEEINGAVIKLAESGSYLAARTLFEFAGVYSLPPVEEESALNGVAAAVGVAEAPSPNRVEAFMRTLGLDPLSEDEPEPDVAA